MTFNHGWFVQAEGTPGAMLSPLKCVLGRAASEDLAFYFFHWCTDLSGAEAGNSAGRGQQLTLEGGPRAQSRACLEVTPLPSWQCSDSACPPPPGHTCSRPFDPRGPAGARAFWECRALHIGAPSPPRRRNCLQPRQPSFAGTSAAVSACARRSRTSPTRGGVLQTRQERPCRPCGPFHHRHPDLALALSVVGAGVAEEAAVVAEVFLITNADVERRGSPAARGQRGQPQNSGGGAGRGGLDAYRRER